MANLTQSPVNPNLDKFRKEMTLLNVTVYPDMLRYKLPNAKLAEGCIPMALNIILKHSLPLVAERPGNLGNTFIVKEVIS